MKQPADTTGQSKPVRVLVVTRALADEDQSDGIANFVRAFVRYMPDDFQVEYCGVANRRSQGVGWQTRVVSGREIRYLTVPRLLTRMRGLAKARAVLGMLRARRDLITRDRVLQVHEPAFDLGLIGSHSPLIRVVHADLSASRGGGPHPGLVGRLVERFTFGRAAKLYFVNRATYKTYADRGGDRVHRLGFLPNFVDTSVFHPLSATERAVTREALAIEFGLNAELPWVLFAGRLVARKKPLLALQAFTIASTSDKLSSAQLLIAGDGPVRAELESAADATGISERVCFLGFVSQDRLRQLMQCADAFLLSSAWEGGPTVVYEALAAGLPVVSPPVGEVPHVVDHSSTGWVVDEGTDESIAANLATGLEWTLSQDRAEIAERCARSMEPFHTKRVLAPFYDDHRVLAGQKMALETR